MNWKGDKSLPKTFMIFLMLTAFFVGEVMPVVIGIFGGEFGTYGAKEPVIKTLSDFGLVLIIYSLYGIFFWVLYRYVNWKIVGVFALVLAYLLERFVYWQVEGSINIVNYVSVGTFVQYVIIYLLVLVVPYGIFQAVRRKWDNRGITNAIIVILVLNILGLGFTAYTMFKINWWDTYQGAGGPNETVYPDLKMITPFVNESDVSSINAAFSSTENSPWGFKSTGINFIPASDLIPVQAVADGNIEKLNSSREGGQGWRTELCINHNPFLVCYSFETFSPDDAIGQNQSTNIFVKNDDKVKQGDLIGRLVRGGDGAHIDLGVLLLGRGGERICPEQYFTDDARDSVLRLIHKDHPTWSMCY